MQGNAFALLSLACFAFAQGEEERRRDHSLAGLLLAANVQPKWGDSRVLHAQPKLCRHASPSMIKKCRTGIDLIQKPRMEKMVIKKGFLDVGTKLLEQYDVLLTVKSDGLSVKQRDMLKDLLPETAFASVIKNKILILAADKFPEFNGIEQAGKGCNIWIFAKFEDLKDIIKAVNEWRKESGVDPAIYDIKGGVFDGEYLDRAGVTAASLLPTKRDLMAKLAGMIKAIPTKVAKGVKEVPTKMARGVKQLDAERLARVIKAVADKQAE